eukprot:COSAG05_NODE_2651_length_2801_cov_28.578090_2_plen_309_part_00
MGKKKAKAKQRSGEDQGGAGGQTARQVEAVVIGGLCAEFCPSLLLKVGTDCTIMFSAGSGLQRYSQDQHVQLSKLSHVMLMQTTAEAVGGLAGLIITVAETGKKQIKVVGPAGTASLMAAAELTGFINRPELKIESADLLETTTSDSIWAGSPTSIAITPIVCRSEDTECHTEGSLQPESGSHEPQAKHRFAVLSAEAERAPVRRFAVTPTVETADVSTEADARLVRDNSGSGSSPSEFQLPPSNGNGSSGAESNNHTAQSAMPPGVTMRPGVSIDPAMMRARAARAGCAPGTLSAAMVPNSQNHDNR